MLKTGRSEFGHARLAAAARSLAEQYGLSYVELEKEEIDEAALRSVPAVVLQRRSILPYRIEQGRLKVAISDPGDVGLIDELRLATTLPLELAVASPLGISRVLAELDAVEQPQPSTEGAADAPAARALELVLRDALEQHASDIHLLPTPSGLEVRLRIDGIVREQPRLDLDLGRTVVARVKVLAELDIAEHRTPQDGRFTTGSPRGGEVDVRVAVLPTVDGEGAVLRLLETSRKAPSLTEIGLSYEMQMALERITGRSGGAFVVAGPTGAGKSTTLTATLADLRRPDVNIITVEDPVEYRLPGVYQLQVNRRADLTFANALRSMLRADPDVVMVGEIRDSETAALAIEAALAGHLILTTLHAKDAPSALIRLLELGVEPFLVASAVAAVLAQRLVRRLCTHCREPYEPSEGELARLSWPATLPIGLYRPRGCGRCDRGYAGRVGVFELMPMTQSIVDIILQRGAHTQLVEAATSAGMTALWADGLQKAARGETSLDELRRVLS